ncbi:hypothetical protein CVT25_010457 [Psilocybe cyanescens]|uniref:Uncharacterized protein n=1 Tax=Psilocybe cyanescens TaxID=93625 RepID=A0A409XQB9_PSICY|nr:hypothetical protein CVT25_010457 [Psilocybe cyanescens]
MLVRSLAMTKRVAVQFKKPPTSSAPSSLVATYHILASPSSCRRQNSNIDSAERKSAPNATRTKKHLLAPTTHNTMCYNLFPNSPSESRAEFPAAGVGASAAFAGAGAA